ncbi:MAG: HAD family hydrolase [Candidatus Kapaibacterium sp.]
MQQTEPIGQPPPRKLLILDLDETIIYATGKILAQPHDFHIGGKRVYKRPYLNRFLEFAFERFDVAIWTQSHEKYSAPAVTGIFPEPERLAFVWTYNRCTFCANPAMRQYYWVKDLRKVRRRGYRLENVIMIDDSARKLERSWGNLMRIRPFHGDHHDRELEYAEQYLRILYAEPNVRTVDKRYWREEMLGEEIPI